MAFWGGIERVIADKANAFSDITGYEVAILTLDQGEHLIPFKFNDRVVYRDLGICYHRVYKLPFFKKIREKSRLKKLIAQKTSEFIESFHPDVVIGINNKYLDFIVKICRMNKLPLVIESHADYSGLYFSGFSYIKRWRDNYHFKKADAIVALTKGSAEEWSAYNRNVVCIPNIVKLNETGRYSDYNSKRIIFVGRFEPQKGLPNLLKIWHLVHSRHKDWFLDMYGEGSLHDYFNSEISQHPDNLNVVLHKPTSDIIDKYIGSSMLVVTSEFEPFGLVIPEAMSCGLPVVSFDCNYGPAEIITDGKDGFLIKPKDINDFADKICRLIEDNEMRKSMGLNAIITSKRYAPENIIPIWIDFFDKNFK